MNLENGSIVNQYKIISASCVMFRFHNESVYKVDFIVLKNDPYRQEECARRQQVTIEDF